MNSDHEPAVQYRRLRQQSTGIANQAQVGDLSENEHVHGFYGCFDEEKDISTFNRDEVSDVKWLSIPDILQQIEQSLEIFTEWFKIYMARYRDMIKAIM